ncbi:hypothetical protein RUM44_005057 [Polyplax serrata]|uniref:Uncharacterized protein n=1 Tax=Polyplax serrata TaxID=468196 RepID=A0ABR1AWW0_POLSC
MSRFYDRNFMLGLADCPQWGTPPFPRNVVQWTTKKITENDRNESPTQTQVKITLIDGVIEKYVDVPKVKMKSTKVGRQERHSGTHLNLSRRDTRQGDILRDSIEKIFLGK